MKFNNEADFAEWIGISQEVIKAFQARGYALYAIGASDSVAFIGSIAQIDNLITFGPIEDVIELGVRYIPLPLVNKGQRDNPKAVRAAINQMMVNLRGPFFLDLQTEDDRSITLIGTHLIDSIYIEPPYLYLVIDSRFGSGKAGSIKLHLAEASHKIRKQLMLALRKNSIPVDMGTVQ